MIEKKWTGVPAVFLTATGTSTGKVSVTSTRGFKVKMRVTLKQPLMPSLDLEVKRVTSSTTMELGPVNASIGDRADLSSYTTAASVFSKEQVRQDIPVQSIVRATYEEEPTVAWRAFLVDRYGNPYEVDNPFPVDAQISTENITVDIDNPNDPEIFNVSVALASTEYSQTLPSGTKQFMVRVRDCKSNLQMSFVSGQTSTNFIKIYRGTTYCSPDVDLDSATIYFESDKPLVTVEILAWVLV